MEAALIVALRSEGDEYLKGQKCGANGERMGKVDPVECFYTLQHRHDGMNDYK